MWIYSMYSTVQYSAVVCVYTTELSQASTLASDWWALIKLWTAQDQVRNHSILRPLGSPSTLSFFSTASIIIVTLQSPSHQRPPSPPSLPSSWSHQARSSLLVGFSPFSHKWFWLLPKFISISLLSFIFDKPKMHLLLPKVLLLQQQPLEMRTRVLIACLPPRSHPSYPASPALIPLLLPTPLLLTRRKCNLLSSRLSPSDEWFTVKNTCV